MLQEPDNQNALNALNQEWAVTRRELSMKGRDGKRIVPSLSLVVLRAVATLWIIGTFITLLVQTGAPAGGTDVAVCIFAVFLLLGGFGVVGTVYTFVKYKGFRDAERQYHARQAEIASRRTEE